MQSKLPDVGTTIFTVMSGLANEHNAINLSQGFPNFKIDEKLRNFVIEGLMNEHVQYAPMAGRLDLREEIAKKIFTQHAVSVNPADEITVTAGATQAIFSAVAALVQLGDEVILFDPSYDCYAPSVALFGGKSIHLKLAFPDYTINWNEVEERINSKTKAIIINNPNNPSGSVLTQTDILALEKVILNNPQIYIVSDEVYEHLQFSGEHQSVLKSEILRAKSFVTYSFGKTFHVTGWKLGYCIAPVDLSIEFRKIHQFNVFCVNNTMQYAAARYLNVTNEWMNLSNFYKEKRDLFLNLMKESRFKALRCDGTYFCLFDYSDISNEGDLDFVKRLTSEFKVAAIPVSAFYADLTDNKVIRLCFAKTDETLFKAAEKLCKI